MATFKIPKPITVSLNPWVALVTAKYLHTVVAKEVPTLGDMLSYVASDIECAVYRAYPLIQAEHLREQTEAYAEELIGGVDTWWEEQCRMMDEDDAGGD